MIQLRHKLNTTNTSKSTNYLEHFFKEGFKYFEHNFKNRKLPEQNEIDKVVELIINSLPLPQIVFCEKLRDNELVSEPANKASFDLLHVVFFV